LTTLYSSYILVSTPKEHHVMHESEDLMTAAKAAEYLGVTPARIHAIRAARHGFGRQIGGIWFYTKQELDAYQATKQRPNPTRPKGSAGTLAAVSPA
jgi:hypothetical protein